MERFISLIGIFVLLGICYLISENKKRIDAKLVSIGIFIQVVFAFIILKTTIGRMVFEKLSEFVTMLLDFTKAGSSFLFGGLVSDINSFGFIFAFQVLPTIIFFSSLMSVLYHLGIMQFVIKHIAGFMAKFMGTSGAESLSAAANIFVGQTEAPLVIKPYIEKMTKSELNAVMIGGMATVAGGVMAGYVGMGVDAGHLIAASVMSAPAALVAAKIIVPETEEPVTKGNVQFEVEKIDANIIDAAARGASEGLQLALNVAGMLLAFVALIAMVNAGIESIGNLVGMQGLNLETILGYICAPLAYIMGVPAQDMVAAGSLLGTKTVVNEFVAYAQLAEHIKNGTLQPRTITILTYALCGFANFSSIAIQLGGIGGLAPNRRGELAQLGIKALIGGTVAAFLTASIAGMLI
ncbi:NupC/NupG family nucleoside CNT transporter [Tepidibacter formicigenes]|jgi:CNT family concentrative nucleoside transporter|uniref:Nucleoside permease n=1 Tax=Tepidibacter formicigenes DSM 15518 TaxID=1123349 RepID=A0A1M6TF62_9FIRM|nr:NupC/NupG family nucleoside CNT transporter [Tepidibacter formicigenes]SHK55514.1 concentrative nucleoside transporter, CNT family [Tepidibacter formicigenes DSM 15518]